MKNRRIHTLLLVLLNLIIGACMPGCDGAFDQTFKLISRTLPSLSKIVSGVLCQDDLLELPAIMRFDFEGRMGWITFEERYQGKVWASYRVEPQKQTMSVPSEYGKIENPAKDPGIGQTLCGMMELNREGKSLKGYFQEDSDTSRKGELVLQFSHSMQSFTGKSRLEGEDGWNENLTGSAN